jgi:Winged helix DNA-binding domain
MTITARGLNRATLARQLLLAREPLDVVEATRRVVALQAQQPASPYLALWSRVSDFDPGELDAAFADGTLVKATLMRFTLHVVHAEDRPAMHLAVQPSLRTRLIDGRYTRTGLNVDEADAVVPDLLAFTAVPRTGAEVEQWLGERLDVPPKRMWWALRTYAPLLRAPTGGPWSFDSRTSFVAAATEPTSSDKDAADEALQTLVRRYLDGFGPASVADMALFALVARSRVRTALRGLSGTLEELPGPDGVALFDIPGASRPADDTHAPPRLLPMWDSSLLAYADKSRLTPSEFRASIARSNGDVLPTLLVDGYVAGVWRPVEQGIEATAFRRLSTDEWEGLAAEAAALTALLADREPRAYRRYDRWWVDLPTAEVRVLPA